MNEYLGIQKQKPNKNQNDAPVLSNFEKVSSSVDIQDFQRAVAFLEFEAEMFLLRFAVASLVSYLKNRKKKTAKKNLEYEEEISEIMEEYNHLINSDQSPSLIY